MYQRRHLFMRVIATVAIFAAGLGIGAGYMVYASATGDVYNACLTSKGDIYRVRVNAKYTCLGSDKSISWNLQGPAGPQGVHGVQGAQGLQGLQGQPGQDGEDAPPARLVCPGCNFFFEQELFQELGDLTKAYLTGANLSHTDLSGLNLTNAKLEEANLTFANLEGADLTEAQLYDADLSNAQLDDAIIDEAFIRLVDFTSADLSGATGTPDGTEDADWFDTTCPDDTNSDDNGDTCEGHFLPSP